MNQIGSVPIMLIVLAIAVIAIAAYFLVSNMSPIAEPTSSLGQSPLTAPILITNTIPQNWQLIDTSFFKVSVPPGWKFNKLPGKDSARGEFVGDGAKLVFDYGWYSSSLAEDNDPKHTVTYETIDGFRAKIVVPRVVGDGTTGVYFGDLPGETQTIKLEISGNNLTASEQETAIKIFRTLSLRVH